MTSLLKGKRLEFRLVPVMYGARGLLSSMILEGVQQNSTNSYAMFFESGKLIWFSPQQYF
jgi:hypothetical protein